MGFAKSEPAPLYVWRKLLNADELKRWAKSQGFPVTLPPEDMHVTVLYSKTPVDWMAMGEDFALSDDGKLTVQPGGPRALSQFNQGAAVLEFACSWLKYRHEAMLERGASSDFPDYKSHITITYQLPADFDLSEVEPYRGRLVFGPEVFEEIKDGFDPSTIMEKYDPDQPRAPKGQDNGGQWVSSGGGAEGEAEKKPAQRKVHADVLETLGPEGAADLQRLIEENASPQEIAEVLEPAAEAADSIKPTLTEAPTDEFWASRTYVDGKKLPDVVDHLERGAEAFAGAEGPVRDRQAVVVIGPPAAGKSTLAEALATRTRSAIWDADEAKKMIPEFQGGIGANAVHKESKAIHNLVGARLMGSGTNLIVPTVGGNLSTAERLISALKGQGYHVTVTHVDVSPREAMRRMAARYMSTSRLIPPQYFNEIAAQPPSTYAELKRRRAADAFAQVNANGPPGSEFVIESTSPILGHQQPVFGKGGGGGLGAPRDGAEWWADFDRAQDRLSENRVMTAEAKKSVATYFKVSGVDKSLGLVFGWGIVCTQKGRPYYDVQKNHIPDGAMVEAVTDFMKSSRSAGDMHTRLQDGGVIVHSFPLTADIAKAMGITCDQTGWMVAMSPEPEVLAKFASGEYTGFSIGGEHVEIDGKPVEIA